MCLQRRYPHFIKVSSARILQAGTVELLLNHDLLC
jgi:hypothetical protein